MSEEIRQMEEKRFEAPKKAMSAVTDEDLALEAAIQQMHVAQDMPKQEEGVPLQLTKEESESHFLGDLIENYKPASSINELESQVFEAKTHGATSIEATEQLIRYFTKGAYPQSQGYFMYKDIRVFIPGRAKGFVSTDKGTMFTY